jgi:sortase A
MTRWNRSDARAYATRQWARVRPKFEFWSATTGRRSPRRLSSALLAIGLLLVVFTLCSYAWMSVEQYRLKSQSASAVSVALATAPERSRDNITVLNIPKIDLQAAILDGTGRKALLLAPGHLERTAWPGGSGNAVVAGHRDTFFRRLNELHKGDDIFVRRAGRQYHYAVSSTAIVNPDETSVIRPSPDARLTLITCYPTYYIGPAPKRLVVVATLQGGPPKP